MVNDSASCPLTPALYDLVRTAHEIENTTDSALAEALCRSRKTINREWKRAFEITGIHSRGGLVSHAVKCGWLRRDEAA